MRTYSPRDYGSYYAEPRVLIGHEAADVMAWVAAHPEYRGSIEFERWDFEGSIDVSEMFLSEDEHAAGTVGGTAIELARVA